MDSQLFKILDYQTDNGKIPYRDWFKTLNDKKSQAIMEARVTRLEAGLFGDSKSVGKGVFELRINYGPGFRIYFGIQEQSLIILLCGGDKKTQPMDIKRAQKYWAHFMESNK